MLGLDNDRRPSLLEHRRRGLDVESEAYPRLGAGRLGNSRTDFVDHRKTLRNGIYACVFVEAVATMRAALEAAGVIFVAEYGDGPDVRLRKAREA